jgi:hypothetical protein
MEISITETKTMAFQGNNIRSIKTIIKGEIIDQFKTLTYSASLIGDRRQEKIELSVINYSRTNGILRMMFEKQMRENILLKCGGEMTWLMTRRCCMAAIAG